MKGVTEWYKRRTQWIVAGCAIVVCVALNVDTIGIGTRLSRDEALRASVVAAAQRFADQDVPVDSLALVQLDSMRVEAQALGLPIGWSADRGGVGDAQRDLVWWVSKIGGLLLSIMAASLGAPFWFDVLRKLLGLRRGAAPEPVVTTDKTPPST